ncbi:hypothetical protein RRF57_008661 [Xylaria bambusicola]|uniref:Uncharacterized protein n=1 Tax=Xylaria bambusicola TaxID=326684 RepID=A0AAN7Z8H6_9PEZI
MRQTRQCPALHLCLLCCRLPVFLPRNSPNPERRGLKLSMTVETLVRAMELEPQLIGLALDISEFCAQGLDFALLHLALAHDGI